MGLLRTLLLGRPDGLRARLRGLLPGGPPRGETRSGATSRASGADAGWGGGPVVAAEKALGLQPEAPKDVTPPEGYEVVLHKDALAPGSIVEVIIAGTSVAVANVDGRFHALTNTCPHAEGPLGEGSLEGAILTCPYHGWSFDVTDGRCKTNPEIRIQTYDVRVEKDAVCVRV